MIEIPPHQQAEVCPDHAGMRDDEDDFFFVCIGRTSVYFTHSTTFVSITPHTATLFSIRGHLASICRFQNCLDGLLKSDTGLQKALSSGGMIRSERMPSRFILFRKAFHDFQNALPFPLSEIDFMQRLDHERFRKRDPTIGEHTVHLLRRLPAALQRARKDANTHDCLTICVLPLRLLLRCQPGLDARCVPADSVLREGTICALDCIARLYVL